MSLHELVGPPAVAVVVTTVLAYGGFRALGALVGDGDVALARVRKVVRVGLPATFVVTFVAVIVAGLPAVVDAALDALSPSLVDTRVESTVTQLAGGTAGVLAVVAGYLGLWPAVTRVRDAGMAARTAARRIFRYAMVFVVLLVALFQTVTVASDGGLWLVAVAVVAGVVGLLAAGPYLVGLVHPTRDPTAAERERLDALANDVGTDYVGVRVSELTDAEMAWLDFRGLPGRRHLLVSDYLLDELDDDELRALLATVGERVGRNWLEWRLVVALGGILGVGAGLLGWTGLGAANWLVALGGVGVLLVGGWWGRWMVFRADAAAAKQAGTDTVADAIQRYADLNDADYEWRRLKEVLRMNPSLSRRVDALESGGRSPSEEMVEDDQPA